MAQAIQTPSYDTLPDSAFLRVVDIVGDRQRGIRGLLPISRSAWHAGVAEGVYPRPTRLPHARTTLWRLGDIRALLARLAADSE